MKTLTIVALVVFSGCGAFKGQTGAPGAAGKAGANGQDGAQGPKGDTGSVGAQGPKGDTGAPGIPSGCSVAQLSVGSPAAPHGGALVTCTDGTSSVILNGVDGTNGTNGSNGTNGTNGTDGAPGTVITPIQFCHGFTQTYPSVFAESGICINNELYGVYSANGGFLALLPPGEYSSDGINSSCTFAIGANCQVSQ